ncbi:MAG: inorganic phosphate transporter [Thermoanaerobaculia bacterium]
MTTVQAGTDRACRTAVARFAVAGLTGIGLYLLVAGAMGAGGLVAGFRVTRTLAEKVTPIEPGNGFAANLVSALLVVVASRFALPVSTTHVSTGAIVGVGLSRGGGDLRWKTIGRRASPIGCAGSAGA